jgi:voltage-gated sodium channel
MRVLVSGLGRSVAPLVSMGVLVILLFYAYGMVGWILFSDHDPENWGNLGQSMLTLFVMMTLENWPEYLETAQEVHSWSWVFFVTYVLLASFLLFNVLIAVVLTSMEAAREEDARLARTLRRELREAEDIIRDEREELVDAMRSLRDAVDELEERIEQTGNGGDPGRARSGA